MKKTRLSSLVFFSIAYMWYDESIEHIGFYRYGRYVIEVLIMRKERKELLTLWITLSLQLGTYAAQGIVSQEVMVDNSQSVPVIQIATPTHGVSHNRYESFSTDTGAIFNNATTPTISTQIGPISANPNLRETADLIVNEVVGTSSSKLAGAFEVAGQPADVVIANPNGISIKGVHFINTPKATFTTGVPHMVNGRLENFTIEKGNIDVTGAINAPREYSGANSYTPISKVDLLAKTIRINADVVAQDAIRAVTGRNTVNYADGTVTAREPGESTPTRVALDVGALGGMYGNTISLIGTESGVGVNISGSIDAIAGTLHIDTAGNLTIEQGGSQQEPTSIHSAKELEICSQDLHNRGTLVGDETVTIQSATVTNDGNLQGKQIEANVTNLRGQGVISSAENLAIQGTDSIVYQGGMRSQSGNITVRGKQVEVDPNHIQVVSKDKLHIESQTPTPETPIDSPKPTLENPLHTLNVQPIPHIPSKVVVEDTQEELPIIVDANAPKNRQPILDTARNGIDILHISGVDGNGVSHNAYTQFNVKERGLILNNATKYTKTQLAGYIDKNMFLAGNGAKTIINEVTSTNPSILKGYIEVAGNPADVVIVNPNGMTVNGLSVINGTHMTLQGKSYIDIVGKGYGGEQIDSTFISDNLRNRRSELWGRHLRIDTENLENTGNIAAHTMHISANTMHNAGFVESKDTLQLTGNELVQHKGIMKANQNVHISAHHIRNSNSSVLEAGGSLHITGDALQNDASHVVSHGTIRLGVNALENTNTGAIIAEDTLQIQGDTFANTKGILFVKNDTEIDMKEDVTNTGGLWHTLGNLNVQGRHIRNMNSKGSYFGSDIYVKGNAYVLGKESFENRSSDIIVKGDLTITAPKIQNHKDVFKTGWTISEEDKYEGIPHLDQTNYYEADRKYHRTIHTGTIEEETATSRILSDGTIHITGQDVQNTYSQIMAKDGLQVTADSITNTGYQGTVHYDDIGRDRHYWKYKQKKRWWKRKKWVYGHTDIPYEHHDIFDAESSPSSERIAVLGSHGTTSIQSNAFTNTTLEADGTAYAIRDKRVETTVAPTDVSKLVTPVLEPSKQLYMTTHPLAVPKVEDNPLYTDKKQFLSSDYMVTRLQADPERVYTRLRNGYEDQEIAKEELRQGGHTLTKYTGHDQSLLSGIPNSLLQPGDLRKDGSIVLGKDVQVISQKVDNTGAIQAKGSLSITGNYVRNLNGSMNGNLVSIRTDMLENTSGRIHGKDRVHIEGKDIRNETQVTTNNLLGSQQDTAHGTASITSDGSIHIQGDTIRSVGATIQGGNTVSLVGKDIQVSARALQNRYIGSGVTLDSTKYLGSTVQGHTLQVQGGEITLQGSRMMGRTVDLSGDSLTLTNVTDRTLSDVAVGARGSDYFNRKMVIDEQNLGATIEGETGVKVRMDNNVSMKASTIHSKTGLVDVQAGRVFIEHGTEHHETLSEIHQKNRGFLSSTTRDIYDHRRTDTVVDSTISSGTVKLDGKQDVLVRASHIVGDADVTVTSEGNLTITSAQEESGATHREEVRKSGIFGNGGLSLTIGTQKQADTYDVKSSVAKGSVIGSRFGSVTLGAIGTAQVEASAVASKGDIQVQGSGVTIRNGYTTSHTEETHRFSKSGLTLSVSNRLVDTTTNAMGTLTRASSVKDERLRALLAYKTYDDTKTSLEKSKLKDQAKSLHINLSLGTESSEASTNVDSKIAKVSTVVSEGHIRVTTKKDDIRIEGSDVQGKDITLESANSIYVKGKETTSEMTQSMKQKQGSLGISYDVLQHRFSDISVNASGSKGNIAGTDIVHDPTKITATNTLGVSTKQDLNIKDGVLKGEAIEANIGGNLEIHSVQDTHDYTDHTTSGGMGLSLSKKGVFKSLQSSVQRTDIDSKYTSMIHQSGLYAGSTGFNISVGNTTTLEGALLSSRTDTNTLKTKYLVMKDMENRAKYTYGSKGVSYLADPSIGKSSKQYNELGLVPTIMPGEQGRANSITYSAIAKGVLTVEEPEVNLNTIRRDTEDSIHTLSTIFDKQSIAERQETAKLFSKYMNEAIHRFGEMKDTKGQRIYEDGSSEKVALHALSGAITSAIVKGNPATGALSGGLNEALIQSITKLAKDHPARAQLLSASLGYTIDKLLGGHGLEGASIAQTGTKWNRYGPRRRYNGEITVQLVGALQTKVANKEPIEFKDIENVKFSMLNNGEEEELRIGDLPDQYVVWVADQNGFGQDYLIDKVKKRLIPIYGDFKTQYISVNNKKNIIYTGDDAILKNELHLYPTNEKSVPLGYIIQNKRVRAFVGGFSEGFGDEFISDLENQKKLLEEIIYKPSQVLQGIKDLINEIKDMPDMKQVRENLTNIANEIRNTIWEDDFHKKGVLFGRATEIALSIYISPDKLKLSKFSILQELKAIAKLTPKGSQLALAAEGATSKLAKVDKLEDTVESIGKEAKGIAKATKATKANKNVDKNIETNKKASPKQSTTETASPTTNTTNLADSPNIYRNGEQYKPGTKTRELKENIVYESKGYYYQTDELGRINVAQGDLRLEKGVRNKGDQLKAGGDDRLRGDHGGHLIARIFGGSGELDNLVAMDKIVNTIEYRDVERLWENALKDGKSVNIKITLDYAEANKRPTGFNVKYEIGEFKDEIYLSNGG